MNIIRRLRRTVLLHATIVLRGFVSQLAFGVSALCLDEAGRVLLVRPRFGAGWSLPGGGVGRGEPPEAAILRELAEEVGLAASGPPRLAGLYTRRIGWATNVIAVYQLGGVRIDFRPNFEIVAVFWADPAAPPPGTEAGALRRLAELTGGAGPAPYW